MYSHLQIHRRRGIFMPGKLFICLFGTFILAVGQQAIAQDTWRALSNTGTPIGRFWNSTVWTGNEMIVWGGYNNDINSILGDGGRYNPASDTWTELPANSAPSPRQFASVVWTGTEMIVWGGYNNGATLNTGARYNPANNTWTPMSITSAPTDRVNCAAIWTGSEMIVWGGRRHSQ